MVHAIQVQHYVTGIAKQAAWLTGALIPIGLWGWSRVVRPMLLSRKPWRISEVRTETADTQVIVFEPVGHDGMRFLAGQYACLTINHSPWTLQQHPFSFASSADCPNRLEFGIKSLGDFTELVDETEAGMTAFIEGPFGSFTLDPNVVGAVFTVGGIGITPVISMLSKLTRRVVNNPG